MQSQLSLVFPDKIDFIQWDDCIEKNNGLIYNNSVFLNTIIDDWCGIIVNDYDAVMALPFRKKWGIKYLYTPAFTQQLGLIGKYSREDFIAVIHAVKAFAKYGDYFFNHTNSANEHLHSFKARNNFIIDLTKTYEELQHNYSTNIKRILKKETSLRYKNSEQVDEVLQMHENIIGKKNKHTTKKDYQKFNQLCEFFIQQNNCIIRIMVDDENKIYSAAILLKDNFRLYNIINVTSHEGKLLHANHFLMNSVIKEFSNSQLVFDLEGSEIQGVKEFYEKFGAVNQPYYHWHFNNLPFPINVLKR